MTILKWALVLIGTAYLLTAFAIAIVTAFMGAPWWVALRVGFVVPFKWMRVI